MRAFVAGHGFVECAFTVYSERTRDWPGWFVVRPFTYMARGWERADAPPPDRDFEESAGSEPIPGAIVCVMSLAERVVQVDLFLEAGMAGFARDENDDPVIMETWL